MPNIYSSTGDGRAECGEEASWVNARRSAGVAVDNNNTRDSTAVSVYRAAAKGGGSLAITRRAFFYFDTSGISVAPSEATLKLRGFSTNTSDVIAVRSTAADPLVAGGFDDLHGASTALGNTDGSGAGTLASVSGLTYSSEISSWSVSGYNDIALNSTALNDMASLDDFKICIMDYDYDYLDVDPGEGTLVRIGFYWADYTGTSLDPYIDYTAGAVATTDNSVFFGCNF